jgi:hypothetical protein
VTLDDGNRKYVYGQGLAYAVAGSSVEIYHDDRLGTVRALTDLAGGITATYDNDEWGRPTAATPMDLGRPAVGSDISAVARDHRSCCSAVGTRRRREACLVFGRV